MSYLPTIMYLSIFFKVTYLSTYLPTIYIFMSYLPFIIYLLFTKGTYLFTYLPIYIFLSSYLLSTYIPIYNVHK
jgi:hypothetical protein